MSWAFVFRNFARPPWPFLFALAGLGVVLSIFSAGRAVLPAFCGAGNALLIATGGTDALGLTLALNPPLRLIGDWALMLLAMMPPLLAAPLMHVWRSSLPHRRVSASVLFVFAYVSVWMTVGPTLIILALVLQLVVGEGAFVGAALLAVGWSGSPWQRLALNRSHRLRRIGLFGWSAGRDALAFGATHAVWCVISCWAWMVLPLTAGRWHIPIMLLSGAIMLGERLRPLEQPRWRVPAILSLLNPAILMLRQGAARHG